MMQNVKYAIAWLWGLAFMASIQGIQITPAKQDGAMALLGLAAWMVFIISDVLLFCLVLHQLIHHWEDTD